MRTNETDSATNGFGIALGMIVCGLLILIADTYAKLGGWPHMVALVCGFLFLLIGAMGICIEFGKTLKDNRGEHE